MKMRNPHEHAPARRGPFGPFGPFGPMMRLAALCGLLGLGLPFQGCSLVTWALGESRSASRSEAPPTPASPLAMGSPAPAAASDARPGPAGGPPGNAAGSTGGAATAEPAASASATAPGPAAGSTATSAPVPGSAAAPSPTPDTQAAPARANAPRPAAQGAASPPAATAAPAPAAATTQAVGGPYTVQFGAFRNAASAQTLREQVAARLAALPEMAALLLSLRVAEHAGLHRVWIGSAATVAEAATLAARLRAATGREVFVTRP